MLRSRIIQRGVTETAEVDAGVTQEPQGGNYQPMLWRGVAAPPGARVCCAGAGGVHAGGCAGRVPQVQVCSNARMNVVFLFLSSFYANLSDLFFLSVP